MEKKGNSYLWPTSQAAGAAPPTMINHHVPQDRRVSMGVESSGAYSSLSGVTATSGQLSEGNDSTSIQALHTSGLGTYEKLAEVRRGVGLQSSGSSKGKRGVSRSTVPGSFSSIPSVPSAYSPNDKKMSFPSASSMPTRRSLSRLHAARTRRHGLASFIWGGQASQDTCVKMLDRVRQQFREPQWHGHDPLILPPQIPSASRPAHQEIPKFSRAIQLLQNGLQEYNKRKQSVMKVRERGESQGIRSEENWSSRDEEILFSSSLASSFALKAHQRSNSKGDSQWSKSERTKSVKSMGSDLSTLPTAALRQEEEELAAGWSTGKSAFVFIGEKDEGEVPQGRSISSAEAPPSRRSSADASLPIWELNSMESKYKRLQQMEVLERRRVERTEMWDRQVVNETMVVHYVTSVLKQQMEEVKDKERAIRMMIRYEEEKDFYYLYNDSPIAQTISKEWKALREKEMKLARIKDREMLYTVEKDGSTSSKEKAFKKKALFDGVGNASSPLTSEGKPIGRAIVVPTEDEGEGEEGRKRFGVTGGTSGGIVSRTKSVLLSYFNAPKPSKGNEASSASAGYGARNTDGAGRGGGGGGTTALPPSKGEGVKGMSHSFPPGASGGAGGVRLGHACRPRGGPRFPGIFSSSTIHSHSGLEEREENNGGDAAVAAAAGGGIGDGPLLPKVTKVDPALLLPPDVTDVRLIVDKYVQQKACQVVEGGRHKGNAFILPPSTESTVKRGLSTGKGGASLHAASASMSSTEVRRVSALVLPPIQSTTISRRTVVGVADYITLLDEDDQYRALIEISEKEERKDIQRLMREDWRTVMDWQRKCMHLNRLVYWRDQREANVREEVERLTRTVGQEISETVKRGLENVRTEETIEREEIHRQEMENRLEHMLLLRLELESDQRGFFSDHVSRDKDCLVQWYYTGYRTIMLAEERHARKLLEMEEQQALEQKIVQQAHVLHLLQDVVCHPQGVAAVASIQKAYDRYRRGMLGYRRTHHLLGREIQAKRTEKKLVEGLEVFEKYKRELYEEMHAVQKEEREKLGKQVERLVSAEFSDRLALISHEGMNWTTVQRTFLRVLREDIIGGEIQKETKRETEERLEIGVKADLEREAIFSFVHRCRRLIHQKEMLVFEEGKARKAIIAEEVDLRHLLGGDEGRAREEIRLEEVTQLAKQAAARAAIAVTFMSEWHNLEESALTTHTSFLLQLSKKAITKLAFEERFYQHLLYQETIPAVWKAYVAWMEEDHRIYAAVQWKMFRLFQKRAEFEFVEEVEAKERSSLGNEEAVTFHALRHTYLTILSERKALENEEERAVRLLCRVWRQYSNQELGRSGTRRFLHEAFRAKREAHFIASRKAEQKKLLASVKRNLEREEKSIKHASAARLECSLEEIEYQEEPKKRWEIREEEEMIFHILQNNCFSFQTGRFDNRNQLAMLWQHESYERVLLQREWWRGFEKVFYPKKSLIREEVSAMMIQRKWREHTKRMAQLARRMAAETEIFYAETSDRLFTMEREAVYYVELYHEILTKEWEASVLFALRPQMEVKEAQECSFAALLREEWTARCDILWEMRYDVADGWLMSVEQRERKALTETQLLPLLQIAAFTAEERLIRQLLQKERVLFLFRITLRVEALQRQTIVKAYQQAVVQEWLVQQESLHRHILLSHRLAHFWRDTIYLPLATAMKNEIDTEERPGVSRLVAYMEEWDGRRALQQQEVAARRSVVIGMEWMDRGALQTEEQFARDGSIRLNAKEHERRIQLTGEWAVGLRYVPSSFAPHHVYVPASLFDLGIQEAEALVRAYLQRSEETSRDALREVLQGILEEHGLRLVLEEEEKHTRERRLLQVMECEVRNGLIHDWAVGLQYVPSSFAPTVVNQPLYIFADGVAQTEAHSRDYITLAEEEERKDLRRSYRLIHSENQSRRWVEHQEDVAREVLLSCGFEEQRHRFLIHREYFIAVRYAPSSFAPSMVYSRISLFVQFVLEEEEILRRQQQDSEWLDRQRIQRDKRDVAKQIEKVAIRRKENQKNEVVCAERAHRKEIVENAMVFFPRELTMLCRVPTPPLTANACQTSTMAREKAVLPLSVQSPPSGTPQSGTPSSSSSPLPAGTTTVWVDAPPLVESEAERSKKEETNGASLPSLPPLRPERKKSNPMEEALEPSMPSSLPPLVLQNERYVYYVEALESLERKSRKFISRRCIKAYLTLWETAFQERELPLEERKWVDDLARAFYVEELNAICVEDEESEDYWDVGDDRMDTLMLMRRDHNEEDKEGGEDNDSPSSPPEFYFQRKD